MVSLRILDKNSVRISATVAAAGLVAVGLPAASAQASSKPPVVKVNLGISKITVSGAKNLKAGWTTIHLTTDYDFNQGFSLALELPGFGTAAAKAARSPQDVKASADRQRAGAKPADSGPPSCISQASTPQAFYDANIKQIRQGEKQTVPLGGASASKQNPTDLTVQLPAGTISLSDSAGNDAKLVVRKGTNKSRPPHADAVVSEGGDNVMHSSATLPRHGTLEIHDTSTHGYGWHAFYLGQLAKGADKKTVQKYYAQTTTFCFTEPFAFGWPVTGPFTSLAARGSIYISYRGLGTGKYAVADPSINDKNGHLFAGDGSIALTTVK